MRKGLKCEAAARKAVRSHYRLFFNAAQLSGASDSAIIPMLTFLKVSTTIGITMVQRAMAHLPGAPSVDASGSALQWALENNWFAMRDSVNRRQRSIEHGQHTLVRTTCTHTLAYIVYMYIHCTNLNQLQLL